MRPAPWVLALVLAAGLARAQAPAPTPGQQRFEAATALEARGDYAAAAAALEAIGHELPDDSFAPDALYEAAVVSEERLGQPARAQKLYAEVATRYTQSRLWRRAKTRADFLARSLSTGEAPLREYDSVMAGAVREPAAARERMEKLLAEHQDFALTDRALYWLGQSYAQAREQARALDRFTETERRFPTSEWAARAKKARADLLLAMGHPFEARVAYRELNASGDILAHAAGKEGLADSTTWLWRALVLGGAIVYLVAFVALAAWSARRGLFRAPVELWYYAPVAILFAGTALAENRSIGWCTFGIGLGGGLLVWLSAAGQLTRLRRGPMALGERVGRSLGLVVAVLAVCFIAMQLTGLTDVVLETFRAGPERG